MTKTKRVKKMIVGYLDKEGMLKVAKALTIAKSDNTQALTDALEQAGIEIEHYKYEIEKQAVEIESLEFKLKAKPVMTKEEVAEAIKQFDISWRVDRCEDDEDRAREKEISFSKEYLEALASKLIGRG